MHTPKSSFPQFDFIIPEHTPATFTSSHARSEPEQSDDDEKPEAPDDASEELQIHLVVQPPVGHQDEYRFGAVRNGELAIDPREVELDRMHGQRQPPRDLLVGETGRDEVEDFPLTE